MKVTEKDLIAAGVKNLKSFGYPAVNTKNILTDMVYSAFFKSMLKDNQGKGCDDVIAKVLARIKVTP